MWACTRRCVLRVRCEHFRARCDSGMRDARDHDLPVPEHFSKVWDPHQYFGAQWSLVANSQVQHDLPAVRREYRRSMRRIT